MRNIVKSKSTKLRAKSAPKAVTVRSRKVIKLTPLHRAKKVAARKQRSVVVRRKAA